MNKDVIYIDVDDDITAIIGKVKDSKEKIVALVPPKRIGVLQSAVNLRLLNRAAEQHDKRLVLISGNSALLALAAAAKIPVAKNLQSKPEIGEMADTGDDEDEDIIDGNQLSIGDHAKTARSESPIENALRDVSDTDDIDTLPKATPPMPGKKPVKPRTKTGIKVPNFNSFRKKLILGAGGGVLLVGFLVWALFFAPSATVIITARTSDSSTNAKVTLSPDVSTDLSKNTVKAVTQQLKKDMSVEFDPTGKKEIGDKATGTMKLTRTSTSSKTINVPSGTSFTASGRTFYSTEAASLAGTTVGESGLIQSTATVHVEAAEVGDQYNLSARSYQSNVGGYTATGSDMSGGTSKEVTVVSDSDIQKATDTLKNQNTDDIKKQLSSEFDTSVKVIDATFKSSMGDVTSSPAVNQEATGKAKLTTSVTYELTGVDSSEFGKYLDAYFAKQIGDNKNQRVYDNGAGGMSFTNLSSADNTYTANIVATAKIGPKIDDNNVKDLAKGKRYGEIQSALESIQGVDNVDVKFWPFWVSTAPNDTNKIVIEFNLNESN